MIRLVTGGVRSGKSGFAERMAARLEDEVLYVATGVAGDTEMEHRVAAHRRRRPASWGLLEEPLQLPERLSGVKERVLLVDCLSTWTANRMMRLSEEEVNEDQGMFGKQMEQETDRLLSVLEKKEAILVTSEVGLGGVLPSKMGRMFQDALGSVNQRVARAAGEVWMVVSGVPWRVKG
ncbi:bifunctional adenosylcobinamide kinase/adenosylcobinamide-phosphate guanylyltransferase [Paludifilum halophilum]|uniref:Adenosylcobinamide kinase n=1 Tax=Paludifilum halophilum TaxID=1642702 RepID=A0A235B6S7_9BACL|nr:bifunctional adenosylcobinamide kinase/adenosylcobinamide-phosphate guanylyltransferase [Paludifilum halophilum]OYD07315.1 bifunctional adenosylcobinamide kinase/adenosylcobinamide-phosphate guanylyltransferase [Paludifilum halophilum]